MPEEKSPATSPGLGVWSGRFGEPLDELTKRYTASIGFDYRLAEVDIQGSLAHARMLTAVGVLSAEDWSAIERGLQIVLKEVQAGTFPWSIDQEDVHLNIEKRLTELVGPLEE
jgi:argininosuccinate lyase